MNEEDRAFLARLLEAFRLEAAEHVENMSNLLLELEKSSDGQQRADLVQSVFREAHSLKGAARSVGLVQIEALCRAMESVFSGWKSQGLAATPELFDLLHTALESLNDAVGANPEAEPDLSDLAGKLEARASGAVIPAAQAVAVTAVPEAAPAPELQAETDLSPLTPEDSPEFPAAAAENGGVERLSRDTVRVSARRLEAILRKTEEMTVLKLANAQILEQTAEMRQELDLWRRDLGRLQPVLRQLGRTLETASGQRLDNHSVNRLLEYVDSGGGRMRRLEGLSSGLEKSVVEYSRSLSRSVDFLLAETLGLLTLPASSLFRTYPKLVRRLAREQGKQIGFELEGESLELDRRVLQELKDPLNHILRNSIDHGIEKPEDRLAAGKPAEGRISLRTRRLDSGRIEIAVSDDGRGVDVESLRREAQKKRILAGESAEDTDRNRLLALAFEPGLSTSAFVTDLSGRGLGLNIVREALGRLGGTVSLESTPLQGTCVRMVVPVSVSTTRAVLLRSGGRLFLIPSVKVGAALKVPRDKVGTVENRETVRWEGVEAPLVKLREVLRLRTQQEEGPEGDGAVVALILSEAGRSVALQVDEVLAEQEVLIKGLGRQLVRVRNVTGVAVIGTGQAVPVLHAADLVHTAAARAESPAGDGPSAQETQERKASLMVVEDSPTSRMLLKNILEMSGYGVETATNGAEAFARLKERAFDLVVSDVDMPKMNGFVLTSRIRADKSLAALPVILVTALDSDSDRERGFDVGASAYIVKSSFDQGNLLETIKRFI
ncbi:response regulator [bacterium]|nr:response regulator [bacterium]